MTVENENAYRELGWTGVETSFNPAFRAERVEDVAVSYLDADNNASTLTRGIHFGVSLDGDNNVTVTPLSMPVAPGTLLIERNTRALQPTAFLDLEDFAAATHEQLFDRLTMLAAEARRDISRRIGPFLTMGGVVDFQPYRIAAADPVNDQDVATKAYVLNITGLDNLAAYVAAAAASAASAASADSSASTFKNAAQAARDLAQQWASNPHGVVVTGALYSALSYATDALNSATAAATSALALANPDYGFVSDAPTETRDYGTVV